MDSRKYFIMGGSIIGIIIVLLISVFILSSCTGKKNYSGIEDKLVKAAQSYINDSKAEVSMGSKLILTDKELSDAGYIKPMSELSKDNCSGSVSVMNNGGQINYLPVLNCTNYTTMNLKNKVINDNLTSSDDGLYALNGEYVFRGKYPNNHLKFAGQDWYIIKITANGDLKLISATSTSQVTAWDNKFNEVTNYSSGENVYAVSDIYNYLNNLYKGFKDATKKHLIPYDVCTGTRARTNLVKGYNIDCATSVKNQYIGLLNPTDYANASYDKDCTNILKGSCINFNYIYLNIDETWTSNAIADSTYEAILYSGGRFQATPARESHKVHIVIYLSGNEINVTGSGTAADPYVIK